MSVSRDIEYTKYFAAIRCQKGHPVHPEASKRTPTHPLTLLVILFSGLILLYFARLI